ncbi:hypothetical protein [Streptomyces sp. NPDC003077]|uniref:hypothetical protein n=1 Tax=Streptomyces sp. NPDC003077 TaxID=3154443 RepID=UPI0033A26DFE
MSDPQTGGLPLADFDELPVGELEHRIRSLTSGELEELLRHERAHADRAAVVQLLTARLGQLERGGTPSPGGSEPRPAGSQPSRSSSPVSPSTSAEPIHPPPHGHPGQPGKPKGNQA